MNIKSISINLTDVTNETITDADRIVLDKINGRILKMIRKFQQTPPVMETFIYTVLESYTNNVEFAVEYKPLLPHGKRPGTTSAKSEPEVPTDQVSGNPEDRRADTPDSTGDGSST